jgi:hypothetical protein
MSAENPTNKPYPKDTERTESETGKAEQQSTEMRGTSDVVRLESAIEPQKRELADYVSKQCDKLWEQIVKSGKVIHHSNKEVSRTIIGIVDDVCTQAKEESMFYRCVMVSKIMSEVLLGYSPNNKPICELVMRLVREETRKSIDQVREKIQGFVDSVATRLNIAEEKRDEIERRAEANMMEGKFYVDMVFEKVKSLAVQRLKPIDFHEFVVSAELNEFEGKLSIHAVIPKAGEPAETTGDAESFIITTDLRKTGVSYIFGNDIEYSVTDLSRKEIILPPPAPNEKGKDSDLQWVGNFEVVIPSILLPAIDRFLRMGWIPDGTSNEFLDAIRDKIKIIKTPEELFADTLSRVLSGYHWVVVEKTESGQYVLESDIPITADNPWQRYTFLVPADGEVWIPNPMWRKAKDMFEKVRIPRNMVQYIIKSGKATRDAKTCGSERTVRMLNLVVLDIERVKEVLGDEIENHIVFKEPPCEGEGE